MPHSKDPTSGSEQKSQDSPSRPPSPAASPSNETSSDSSDSSFSPGEGTSRRGVPVRQRARRFSSQENLALANLYVRYYDILRGPKRSQTSTTEKSQLWEHIRSEVNGMNAHPRSMRQLKKRLDDIMRDTKIALVHGDFQNGVPTEANLASLHEYQRTVVPIIHLDNHTSDTTIRLNRPPYSRRRYAILMHNSRISEGGDTQLHAQKTSATSSAHHQQEREELDGEVSAQSGQEEARAKNVHVAASVAVGTQGQHQGSIAVASMNRQSTAQPRSGEDTNELCCRMVALCEEFVRSRTPSSSDGERGPLDQFRSEITTMIQQREADLLTRMDRRFKDLTRLQTQTLALISQHIQASAEKHQSDSGVLKEICLQNRSIMVALCQATGVPMDSSALNPQQAHPVTTSTVCTSIPPQTRLQHTTHVTQSLSTQPSTSHSTTSSTPVVAPNVSSALLVQVPPVSLVLFPTSEDTSLFSTSLNNAPPTRPSPQLPFHVTQDSSDTDTDTKPFDLPLRFSTPPAQHSSAEISQHSHLHISSADPTQHTPHTHFYLQPPQQVPETQYTVHSPQPSRQTKRRHSQTSASQSPQRNISRQTPSSSHSQQPRRGRPPGSTSQSRQPRRGRPPGSTSRSQRERPSGSSSQSRRERPLGSPSQPRRGRPLGSSSKSRRRQPPGSSTQARRGRPPGSSSQSQRRQPPGSSSQARRGRTPGSSSQAQHERPAGSSSQARRGRPPGSSSQARRGRPPGSSSQARRGRPPGSSSQARRRRPQDPLPDHDTDSSLDECNSPDVPSEFSTHLPLPPDGGLGVE